MKIIRVKNYEEMSKKASKLLAEHINKKPQTNVCFATGSTPIGMYNELVKMYNENKVSFEQVTSFNLDEYVNLDTKNHCSYHYYMHKNLFNKIDIKEENINFPKGIGKIEKNAKEYDKKIDELNGIDFMILGIGTNAHIAFNEPGSSPNGRTREVSLTESTIESNKVFFDNPSDIPKTAISMGIGNILEAKKIILLASGKSKAKAIYDSIKGPVNTDVPGSFLQNHDDVTVIIDEEAASLLNT